MTCGWGWDVEQSKKCTKSDVEEDYKRASGNTTNHSVSCIIHCARVRSKTQRNRGRPSVDSCGAALPA